MKQTNKILILFSGILIAVASLITAQENYCGSFGGMMSGAYGFGGMWLFGWLFGVLVLVVLVLLIIWLIKQIEKKK